MAIFKTKKIKKLMNKSKIINSKIWKIIINRGNSKGRKIRSLIQVTNKILTQFCRNNSFSSIRIYKCLTKCKQYRRIKCSLWLHSRQ
jgi:hypothetical protein